MADNNITKDLTEHTEIPDELSSDVIKKDITSATVKIDKKRRLTMKPPLHRGQTSNDNKSSDEGSLNGESEDETSFDTFILSNFSPFSGMENVIEWLDLMDEKLNFSKISRKLRYVATPSLVKGKAKRTYLPNQDKIHTYDDFYSLFLTHYDTSNRNAHHATSYSFTPTISHSNITHEVTTQKNVVFDDQQEMTGKTFELTDSSSPPRILRSAALLDLRTTDVSGDVSVNRSNVVASQNSFFNTSNLDQTAYALRRAIIDSLIKNPKTFRGGKEDVKQWLEDIDQLFDTAQIPESHKLDLVQYSLRGEAVHWFKNSISTFTSWTTFVKGLKGTFLSPFFEEIAFKKLESYSQGVNQPVRSFYNEVLKLCNEADASMSDSSKLRNLLNKAKPTLQFEIRKKKPTTSKQFLEYAIEVEELYHLSNLDLSDNSNTTTTTSISSTITTPQQNIPPPKTDKLVSAKTEQEENYDDNYINNNPSRFSQPFVITNPSYRPNYRPHKPWSPPAQPFTPYSQGAPTQQSGYRNPNRPSSNTPSNPSYRRTYNYTNSQSHNNNQQKKYKPQPRVNNISNPNIPSLLDPPPFSPSPVFCSRCQQQGHAASTCSHFEVQGH